MTGKLFLLAPDQQSQSLAIVVFKSSPEQLQLQLQTTLAPPRQSHPGRLYGGRGHRQAEEIQIFILPVSTNSHNYIIRLLPGSKIPVLEFLTGTNTTLSQPDTQCGDGDYLGRTLLPAP